MNARRIVPSVAAMLALLIVGVTAPAANAATGNCAAGYICVWRDHDYKTAGADGTLVRLYYYIPDLSAWQYKVSDGAGANSGIAADDSVTSIYNHGNTELAPPSTIALG